MSQNPPARATLRADEHHRRDWVDGSTEGSPQDLGSDRDTCLLKALCLSRAAENLAEALQQSAYDPRKVSFFSWLGVTYYLTKAIVLNTLQAIAAMAPAGSSVIFDYIDPEAFIPDRAARRMQRIQAIVARVGEPMRTSVEPLSLAADLEKMGLWLKENLSPADIEARYFQGRTDGYHAFEHVHFAWAVVAG